MGNPFARAARLQSGAWSESSGAFEGVKRGRLFYDWLTQATHPDREMRMAIRDLRSRARDLVRNNDYAAGVVDAFADNVIGWGGIQLKPFVRGVTGDPNKDVNRRIRDAWSVWGDEHAFVSVDGVDSWLDVQHLLVKSWVTDGEVFIREHRGADNPFGYALQLLDADLLDEGYNMPPDERGVEIRMGVEMNRLGRPLAYHFYREHPSLNRDRERIRVPAGEIIHHFGRYRIGQSRGYSLFAPVLTTLRMIDGLTEAELVASRLAAAKMGFIENMSEDAVAAYLGRLEALTTKGEDPPASISMDVAPGMIEELVPGQRFTGFDPSHPNEAFEPFLKVMARGAARAFGMSYLTYSGDVGEANYSSMRAGLIPERDHWRIIQVRLAKRVHRRIYRNWLSSALLTGALQLPTPVAADWWEHRWRPRGWKWVDPLKDLLALELGVLLGISSRQSGAADLGLDFEEVIEELAEEEALAEEWDVYIGGSKNPASEGGDEEPMGGNGNGNGGADGRSALNRIRTILEGRHG